MKETTKKYLLENNINSEEQLANHILELRRNTFVKPILFELVDLLYNKKSVLLSFFAQKNSKKGMLNFTELEKNIITEKEQENLSREHIKKSKPMFLDEVLDRIENQQPTVTFSTNANFNWEQWNTEQLKIQINNEDDILKNILSNKGVKETENKTDYQEIDWNFIEGIAKRMNLNKEKYEPFNYHKPMDVNLLKQSLLRHTIEILKGEHNDAGQEYGHIFATALNSMMI